MADALRKIARAYYERASEEEKNEAKQFFNKLDMNGDGKIQATELKSHYLITDKCFKKLDSDGDGVLGFSDVLVLFYSTVKDKVSIWIRCDGCDELVFGGPFFSCLLCLPKHPKTYDLCCDCYGRGNFNHCHPLTNFIHNQNHMGKLLKHHQEKTTQAKGEMEELRKIATMIYKSASADVKASASDFFRSMDKDGDQRVNIREFLSTMSSQQGHQQLQTRRMFQELDRDGDGALDFSEVVTLYYTIKSCRPSCNWCKDFIPGIFFSCVFCFKAGTSYDLCRSCYLADDADHTHDGATQFLDTFAFLQNIREYLIEARHQQGSELSQSQAIVPAPGQSNVEVVTTIVNTICQITGAVCSIVSTAGKCTIM